MGRSPLKLPQRWSRFGEVTDDVDRRQVEMAGHRPRRGEARRLQPRVLHDVQRQHYVHRAFDRRAADLAVTLRGVRVADREQRARHLHRQIEDSAGREIPYCHMEKLCNLEQLPPNGFTIACFPHKIKGGSAGWTRAVALFD